MTNISDFIKDGGLVKISGPKIVGQIKKAG